MPCPPDEDGGGRLAPNSGASVIKRILKEANMPFFEHIYEDKDWGRTLDHASHSSWDTLSNTWSSSEPFGI
jgi:hypothetical protein